MSIRHRFRSCKWDIKNAVGRARRGYGPVDVWSADFHIASVISGMARELMDANHGIPMKVMFEACGDKWRYEPEEDEAGKKLWNEILEGIALGFETWSDLDGPPDDNVNLDAAFDLLKEYFGCMWT